MISDSVMRYTSSGLRLVGGRSLENGKIVFPMPHGVEASRYEEVLLDTEGRLWSYTIQRFPPKSPPYLGVTDPSKFEPFAVGYVELEGQVIVETRLETTKYDALEIGQRMQLTKVDFPSGDGDSALQAFAFRPI